MTKIDVKVTIYPIFFKMLHFRLVFSILQDFCKKITLLF